MEQKPTHKEDPLTTLKETLVNAISTIDRLQCDNNPIMERNDALFLVGDTVEDRHCAMNGVEGVIYHIDYNAKIAGVHFPVGYGSYQFSRLKKIEKQKEENILQNGKDVLQSESLEDMASIIAKKANDMWEKISKKTEPKKEVLNSQNEKPKTYPLFEIGSYAMIKGFVINNFFIKGEVVQILSEYPAAVYFCKGKRGTARVDYSDIIPYKKEVLFTTEDRVDIYEGGECCYVNKKTFDKGGYFGLDKNILDANDFNDYVHFSTREKSAEYILMNKPLLSLNDLLSVWNEGKPVDRSNSIMFELFKGIAKEKLSK